MRRLLIIPAVVLAGLGVAALQSPSGASEPPTVVKVPVSPSGLSVASGFTGEADVASSAVGVWWSGDPGATFALAGRRPSGAWVDLARTGPIDAVPDGGSAEAKRATAAMAQYASDLTWTGPVTAVRVTLVSGGATSVVVAAVTTPAEPPAGSAGALDVAGAVAPRDHGGFAATTLALSALLGALALGWRPWRAGRRTLALLALAALSGLVLGGCRPVPDAGPPPPAMISRAAWGAQPYQCAGGPQYTPPVVFAVVHHTVNSNDYGPSDSPVIVRDIQAYHLALGYCDIAYQFLVDRYGQIFEGRAGGITAAVLGAHTGGFNSHSTSVAVIGDFSSASTLIPPAGWNALVAILRWKFAISGRSANQPFQAISAGGGSYFPAGTLVWFPDSLLGHRNLWPTVCPGDGIFNHLPELVQQVAGAPVAPPTG